MITLKKLNVVRKVATEEQAAKLERQGFTRQGGAAASKKGKGGRDEKKEGQGGSTDQPGSGDGAK